MVPCAHRVFNPNGISIGSAVFAGLSSVTDRLHYSGRYRLTIDRINLGSTGDAV